MALADPYVTAKANLRDNVKILLAAVTGVAGVLLAGTPFSGLGTLPPGQRLFAAVVAIVLAAILLSRMLWQLLRTLQPDLVNYEWLRDGFKPASITDADARAEVKDLRAVFHGQRAMLLPEALPAKTIEALEAHITTLWEALPEAATDEQRRDYDTYHDVLTGIVHWAAFTRLQRRVRNTLSSAVWLALPALGAILVFAWAVNPGKPESAAEPSISVVEENGQSPRSEAAMAFGPVLFQTDLAVLDDAGRGVVSAARSQLGKWPGAVALVRANTDTRGTDRRNSTLAQQRAQVVVDELIRPGGLAANRVFMAALGPGDLPVMTAPKTDEANNRSVQILVVQLPPR